MQRLKDVKTETAVYTLDGKACRHGRPRTASARPLRRRSNHRPLRLLSASSRSSSRPRFIGLTPLTGKREVFAQPKIPFDPSQYELRQVFYKSKDGTRIPMFIAGKKGLKQDGTERLLMTGYGGFNVSRLPAWNPAYAWWLQQGGWFAVPNLRGGGEYGEHWHEQGMFEKKQNVFDDLFAAAEYLIANKYTSPQHFAITGRSNGGLLMGAAITQQPELFSAVLCGYPLLDMLRYQKFLQGPTGPPNTARQTMKSSSPICSNTRLTRTSRRAPPILQSCSSPATTTPASIPLHARKMTALMQAASSSGRPILLHYSLVNGHSAGVSVDQ